MATSPGDSLDEETRSQVRKSLGASTYDQNPELFDQYATLFLRHSATCFEIMDYLQSLCAAALGSGFTPTDISVLLHATSEIIRLGELDAGNGGNGRG
jgi:hypothetical protein